MTRKWQGAKSLMKSFVPQTRFHASGSPGTVFEVPGDSSQRRRQAILTRLSAKAAPGLTKHTRLLIKSTIGDTKHTIPLETVSKSSAGTDKTHDAVNKKSDRRHKHTIPCETVSKMNDLKPSGETLAGEVKFLENGRVPNPL